MKKYIAFTLLFGLLFQPSRAISRDTSKIVALVSALAGIGGVGYLNSKIEKLEELAADGLLSKKGKEQLQQLYSYKRIIGLLSLVLTGGFGAHGLGFIGAGKGPKGTNLDSPGENPLVDVSPTDALPEGKVDSGPLGGSSLADVLSAEPTVEFIEDDGMTPKKIPFTTQLVGIGRSAISVVSKEFTDESKGLALSYDGMDFLREALGCDISMFNGKRPLPVFLEIDEKNEKLAYIFINRQGLVDPRCLIYNEVTGKFELYLNYIYKILQATDGNIADARSDEYIFCRSEDVDVYPVWERAVFSQLRFIGFTFDPNVIERLAAEKEMPSRRINLTSINGRLLSYLVKDGRGYYITFNSEKKEYEWAEFPR